MAFRYILEHTLTINKLESLIPDSGKRYTVVDNDDDCTVVSSSIPGMIPDGFTG